MKNTVKFGGTLAALFLTAVFSSLNTLPVQALPDGGNTPCLLEALPEGYSLARDTAVCEGSPVYLENDITALNRQKHTRTWTAYKGTVIYDNTHDTKVTPSTGNAYFLEVIRKADRCIRHDTVYINVQPMAKIWSHQDTVHVCTEGDVKLGKFIDSVTGNVKSGSLHWYMWPETWKTLVDTPSNYSNLSTGRIINATTLPAVFEPATYKPWDKKGTNRVLVMDSNITMNFRFKVTASKLCAGIEADDTTVIIFSPKTSICDLSTTSSAVACITDPEAAAEILISGLHSPLTSQMYNDIDVVKFSYNPDAVTTDFAWKYNNLQNTDSTWSLRLRYKHSGTRDYNVIFYDTVYVRDTNGCENSKSYQIEFVGWPRILPDTVTICQGEKARIAISYSSNANTQWCNAENNAYAASGSVVDLSPPQTTTYHVTPLKAKACAGLTEDYVTVKVYPSSELHLGEPLPYENCMQVLNIDSVRNVDRIEWLANGEPVGEGLSLTHHLFKNTVFTAKGISPDGCISYDSVFILFYGRKIQTALGQETYQRKSMDHRLKNMLEGTHPVEKIPAGTLPDETQAALGRERLERYIEDLEILLQAARQKLEEN